MTAHVFRPQTPNRVPGTLFIYEAFGMNGEMIRVAGEIAAEGYAVLLPDLTAVKDFILSAQVSAGAYARNYPGTVKEIRKALRVNKAFQQVLDDPGAADALQHTALKPLLNEAADA